MKTNSVFLRYCQGAAYIKNSRGPNTDPCETPHVTVANLDNFLYSKEQSSTGQTGRVYCKSC